MPETLTGWIHQIRDYCESAGIDKSQRQIKNLAATIHQRATDMQHIDPDDLLRNVLVYNDETGELAVKRVMSAA